LESFQASENAAVASLPPGESGEFTPERLIIHLDGKAHQVPYRKGMSILNAAREAGLEPNSSCEQEFCGSCAAKMIKGRATMVKNDVYTDDEVAAGWILTCQSLPQGAEVELTYDES
jgi:3-ketosteroid 9alpha-monooxygenase subunit B